MFLKNPVFFGIAIAIAVLLQVWISYLSARSIMDGDFVQGLSLFVVVPGLALLLILYYLWMRGRRR